MRTKVLALFLSQISDFFRIGLLLALVYTTIRTAHSTGTILPLMVGAIFVAVIIPTTRGAWTWADIGIGLLANGVILAVALILVALVRRFWRR